MLEIRSPNVHCIGSGYATISVAAGHACLRERLPHRSRAASGSTVYRRRDRHRDPDVLPTPHHRPLFFKLHLRVRRFQHRSDGPLLFGGGKPDIVCFEIAEVISYSSKFVLSTLEGRGSFF